MARELWLKGYAVKVIQPLEKAKPLTQAHQTYGCAIGIPCLETEEEWLETDLIIDGLFGFGLTRPIEGSLAKLVQAINQNSISCRQH